MLNDIQAEISKTLKRKSFWITILIALAGALLGCISFQYINARGFNEEKLTVEHFIEIGTMLFPAASFTFVIFVDMITMEEYKNHTIKNIASSGLSRVKIYMSKNIEVILIAATSFIIIVSGALLMAYVIERQLKLKISIPEQVSCIIGETKSVERVIMNLLQNTLRYAKEEVELTIQEDDKTVDLIITNEAGEVKEEDLPYLFNRFFMINRVRNGEGTGIGLAVVKKLVELMKGQVMAELNDDRLIFIVKWHKY